MKKCFALFFVFLLCFALPLSTRAAGFDVPESIPVTAASVYIMNVDTGLTVVDKNAHERRDVASLTKMMTCLLLVEKVADLDGTLITAPTSVYVSPVTDPSASTADIRPGETVTARSLLYGMLLPSGNEAAAVVAYYLGNENTENFYAMMNARAKELGCENTNFTNPHGLIGMDQNNYSSAYDLALIAQACWQYESIRTAASAPSYGMPFTNLHTKAELAQAPEVAYTIYNTNRMVSPTAPVYRSYIKGLKTGSTHAAGRTFASVAVNDRGETYVGVVLGTPWDAAPDGYAFSFHDTMNLYDWIFANFAVQPSLDTTVPITEVTVELSSDTDIVQLLPSADMKTILPLEGGAGMLEHTFDVPEFVNAPIVAGDKIGTLTVALQGTVIGTVDLLAAYDVARNPLLNLLYGIGEFFKGTYFRVVLILTGIYIVLYFSISLWLRAGQRKRRSVMQRRAANLGDIPNEYLRDTRVAATPGTRPRSTGQAPPYGRTSSGQGRGGSTQAFASPVARQRQQTQQMPRQAARPSAQQAPQQQAPVPQQTHAQRLKIPQRPMKNSGLRPPQSDTSREK